MPTQDDVRRIALALPAAIERTDRFAFAVENNGKLKDFAWVWAERVAPKMARIPNPAVLAVRVSGEEQKQFLIGSQPDVFFTEPHYNGFPAVLVRLDAVEPGQLEGLLESAWRIQAPKALARDS
ncbi:MAG TPA: hypothetical protein PKD27_10755 [Tepidiformaceae bacterium]|nr:hypothetical protein [Tepidiformaceae bacterium]